MSQDGREDPGRAHGACSLGLCKRKTSDNPLHHLTPPEGSRLPVWEDRLLLRISVSSDAVSPSHGDMPCSPLTGVCLQLQRSCWQPHRTHTRTPQPWGETNMDTDPHKPPRRQRIPGGLFAVTAEAQLGPSGLMKPPHGRGFGHTSPWGVGWERAGQGGQHSGVCGDRTGAAHCCHGPSGAGLQAVAGLQGWSPEVPFPLVPLGPRDSLHAVALGTGDLEGEKVHHGQAQDVDRTLRRFHSLLQPFLPSLKTHHGRQDGCI